MKPIFTLALFLLLFQGAKAQLADSTKALVPPTLDESYSAGLEEMGRKRFDLAIGQFATALNINSEHIPSKIKTAECYFEMGIPGIGCRYIAPLKYSDKKAGKLYEKNCTSHQGN